MMGTQTSPWRFIRWVPKVGLIDDSSATARPILFFPLPPEYVGTMSKSSLTLVASCVVKTTGSVAMLSWTGRSTTVASPTAPLALMTTESAVSSCVLCASLRGTRSRWTASVVLRMSIDPRLTSTRLSFVK